jgi:hypothetical protein
VILPVPGEAGFVELTNKLKCQIAVNCWAALRWCHYSTSDSSPQIVSTAEPAACLQCSDLGWLKIQGTPYLSRLGSFVRRAVRFKRS